MKKGRVSKDEKGRVTGFLFARSYNKGACRSLKEWQKVRMPDGSRAKVRKHYLQYTLRTCYDAYKRLYPDADISYVQFCAERPPYLKLFKTQNVDCCRCYQCENQQALFANIRAGALRAQRGADSAPLQLTPIGDRNGRCFQPAQERTPATGALAVQ